MTEYIVETRDFGSSHWREAGRFAEAPSIFVYDQAYEWVKERKNLFPNAKEYRVIEEHDHLSFTEVN